MDKITALTVEQKQRLSAFHAEYLAHGLNCAPADRQRAEAAFGRAYRSIGLDPVPVVWVASPITATLAFAALKNLSLKENGVSLRASLWDSLGASLRASLRDSLGASLGASLRDSLGDSLWDSLGAGLRASLGDSLRDSLRDSLGASLRDSLGDSLWDSLGASLGASLGDSLRASLRDSQITPEYTYWWGQQDLYWVAFYKFCAEIGVRYQANVAHKLNIMDEIGQSCMWWYPRDGLIIACDRPFSIEMDDRQRLHNENGPAVEFRDGWKIYAVHGVRVPSEIIEYPNALTIEKIHAETNSEIQRVMIERFGWDRYAAECGASIVDHDDRWGTLFKRPVSGGEDVVFLQVINRSPEPDGTFRKYILPVAPNCEPLPDPTDPSGVLGEPQELTALNAVASTFGMRGAEYAHRLVAES